MSDDIPVCDVLLQAAEYLTKLGSNLKLRTESLKEKRINKSKLKNTHAVQKAADKLLLICELSKKSLVNVEDSVKNILNVCEGNTNKSLIKHEAHSNHSSSSKGKTERNSHLFKYRSQTLRINEKISLKHYISAKVLARKMSSTMMDKYPVYYNCKLYRRRNRLEHQLHKHDSVINKSEENTEETLDDLELKTTPEKNSNNSIDKTPESQLCDAKKGLLCSSEDEDKETNKDIKRKNKSRIIDDSSGEETNKTKKNSPSKNDNSEEMFTKTKESSQEQSQSVLEEPDDQESVETNKNNNKAIRESSSEQAQPVFEETHSPKLLETNKKNNKESKESSPEQTQSVLEENDDQKSFETNEKNNEDIEESFLEQTEKNKLDLEDSDDSKSSKIQSHSTDITKPLIKCIDINKLLKPDGNKTPNSVGKIKKSVTFIISDDDDEDDMYWKEKRKEVKTFVAKAFSVKVKQLPELNEEFLHSNNLDKITKMGQVIVELQENSMNSSSDEKDTDRLSKKPKLELKEKRKGKPTKISSSEEVNMKENNETEKINEKDGDNMIEDTSTTTKNESESKETKEEEINGNEKSNETDNNIEKTSGKGLEKNEESILSLVKAIEEDPDVKSSLLNDSSSSTPRTPQNKRKRSKSSTPQSKRKHIMESMKAKRMLLTYSSSSDTEDENLKNAVKEIKDSLLAETMSNKVKDKIKGKLLESSSSDESPAKEKKKVSNKSDEEEESNDSVDGTKTSSQMGRTKSKPTCSSKDNSDTQDTDKDIDGLTNLNNLNKKSREDSSSATIPEEDNHNTRSKRMPKVKSVKQEEILAADTNSTGGESDEDGAETEDLPAVSLSDMNGGSPIQHLAKEDLLEESDASSLNDGKTSDEKKEESDFEDDKVRSKRRKAQAISSDSEGGGASKKDPEVKMSDFDDSDAGSSGSNKKKRRKKMTTDSDASDGSDGSGKKKRRRIKQLDDSDASGSGSENEGKKHGRKNIRRVMGKDQLEEATKKAAREEKERIARITERQKLYNNLQFDESGKPDEVVLDKVILDFDPDTKEPLIQVDRGLVKKLKPHQANGIKFMWDACFESVKRIKKDRGSGCILAHCMGLGKTLQVVSLTHTLLTHSALTGVRRVLVVCPLSTVLNWVNEFNMWLKHTDSDYEVDVYELSRFKQNSERAYQLTQWMKGGGVCVLGYEMFRNLSADNLKKFRKKMLKTFQEALVDPGPDLVVCDEGHLLKNEKTSLSQSMNRVKTRRRIVLTGTPLQNNLKEYYCMVTFVKPNLLGKYNEYLNRFVNPITNGQYTDSTESDIKVMKRRSHVLHKMLDGAVQRRDYGVLAPFLPPKHEYVLFITLTEVQIKLYQYYLDNYSRKPLAGKSSGFLFPDFQSLQRIWTHPLVLKYNSERYEIMQQKKREREEEEDSEGSLADFIDDDSTPDETSTEDSSGDISDASDDSRKKSKKKKAKKGKGRANTRRGTRANPVEQDPEEIVELEKEEVKNENPTEWWIKLVTEDQLDDVSHSHKLVLLLDILRQCEAIGDKLLVFSQSLYSLDLIEHFLGKIDEATQEGRVDDKLGGHVGSWSPGIDYFRLDGSTSCENRSIWCKNFNREDNPRARLFLISTRAGGLGINLVAANRVVIFDVSWNPSHDVQSIFRVYRFGQKKPCYIYRFLAMGTMEEKIYERQVTKQAISKRVIDEQQIDRHYAENDLAELYTFSAEPPQPRPLPPLPKDRLFAEMLREHDNRIYQYHEHDSLLENKEEETLTEEERKAAWEDFENEKNKPPPAPFPTMWPMHNGMTPGLLAQQQQQLAYAALAGMLRKDMPALSDQQLRDMLPLIYSANPALMQKMGEIYKYAQPGMMNPMMNSVMNSGSGGSTSLQYEPPWQRQQQQQQQIRLQQLLQQQQGAGAKYYAGGLGSRDPVAMALQQQRAREIMTDHLPRRGRPPARPSDTDVVTLDSD